MNLERARADIIEWITGFVEQPHPKLNAWSPCPFARRARLENKIHFVKGRDPFGDLMNFIWSEKYDVVVFVYDPKKFAADEFERQVNAVNKGFLTHRNLIALSDHPNSPEIVNEVQLNQGTYAIVFLQNLKELNEQAVGLAKRGYYNNWPEEYLQSLFAHRKDPRDTK